ELWSTAWSRTHVKPRPPVVGQPQRDRTLLVNADEVIGPPGDVLEGTGDVGTVRLEAQAVPDSRQGIKELSVADLGTVDVPGRSVDGPGYLVGDAGNRLGRDRGLDVPVDAPVEERAGQRILTPEVILERQVQIVGLLRSQIRI